MSQMTMNRPSVRVVPLNVVLCACFVAGRQDRRPMSALRKLKH